MWVDNYCSIHSSVDNKYIDDLLLSLKNGANEVVRIPYILYTCIERKVDFTKVSHPKELYDALFCGVNARSAITEYNQYPRYSSKEWRLYEDKIDELALAVYHSSEYTISREQLKKIIGSDNVLVSQFATEFFLKRVGDSYKFIHNSIYEYFIAKIITSYVDELLKSNNTELFLKQMDSIIGKAKTLNFSLVEFISQFITYNSSSEKIEDIIIDVLKSSTRVYFKTTRNESIFEILKKMQNRFVIIMSVFAEYIKKHCRVTKLLQNLSEDELNLFIRFTNFHDGSFTFIGSFNLDNVELKNIKLSGTNLSSLAIDGLKLKDANLKGTTFVGSYMHNFTATNTDMRETNCKNADFNGCVLIGSDLRNSRLNGANLYCGNLMLTDLRGATLIKTNLNGVNFFYCKISVEQLAFIHLDVVIRFNINVYDGEKLLKIKDVIEYYKEKHPVRYMFNYYDSPLLPHSL